MPMSRIRWGYHRHGSQHSGDMSRLSGCLLTVQPRRPAYGQGKYSRDLPSARATLSAAHLLLRICD